MKTRKTAGTSIQSALSEFCGPDDIITPDVDTKHLGRNIFPYLVKNLGGGHVCS